MSSWSQEQNQSPGGLNPHLSRTLLLLLLSVASAQGDPPNPNACLVFQSVKGTTVNCHPPAEIPRRLPADTVHLAVEFFNLTQLPADILRGTPKLQELHLSSNRLENLSAEFLLPVPQLKNRLRTLPAGLLANLTDLRVLDLSNNRLETLPPDLLRGPQRLERLHLEGNRLRALEDDLLAPQKDLRHLFLSDNQLAKVAANAFRGLRRLDFLDLSNNSLSSVPKGLWAGLGRPTRDLQDGFDLSQNPWICDGNLRDLFRWLVDNKDKMFFRNDTRCAAPAALKGWTLLAVAESH
ncbi:hypothetical protein HPG69_007571 [Diceros bicornis minor]|uniref:LRRCT domain-containing protein n=1 Tax=Diceros bicornis minor TaxID=77932 RepID=A0A7J7EZ63_DICBM|nr:hypothetical protein HPG69_007571 [Diceros bicornis minor]